MAGMAAAGSGWPAYQLMQRSPAGERHGAQQRISIMAAAAAAHVAIWQQQLYGWRRHRHSAGGSQRLAVMAAWRYASAAASASSAAKPQSALAQLAAYAGINGGSMKMSARKRIA